MDLTKKAGEILSSFFFALKTGFKIGGEEYDKNKKGI